VKQRVCCQRSTGKNCPHQFDQTKPLPKGLGSQEEVTEPFVSGPLHVGMLPKIHDSTNLPLRHPPSWEGSCCHFGAFLCGRDPPHRPPPVLDCSTSESIKICSAATSWLVKDPLFDCKENTAAPTSWVRLGSVLRPMAGRTASVDLAQPLGNSCNFLAQCGVVTLLPKPGLTPQLMWPLTSKLRRIASSLQTIMQEVQQAHHPQGRLRHQQSHC
jgi:hypothetical protein